MHFSLATTLADGTPTPVLIVNGRHHRIADVAPDVLVPNPAAGLMTVFAHWQQAEPVLLEAAGALAACALTDGELTETEVPQPNRLEDWLTPLRYPSKVICTGANYYDHMTQDGGHSDFSKEDNIPVFFLKPPTTTLVGQGKSVRYPVQSAKFDYELELAFVIGKRGHRIAVEEARDHIAGYTIGLDLSARDWQRHPQHLAKFDLFGGKAFDDSCPLGPAIVPARFVDDRNLQLQFRLNGELKQNANTKDMIWSVPELVARISEHVTLEPGDVVLTGTPAGVGLSTGIWTHVGDRLQGEITGLGSLQVEIIDDHPDAAPQPRDAKEGA
jgi:2-keto-4-pentenoate hydratase/2-oxohepta-3-ene-1,7-dioic acid hydratase in catechol pathway